MYMLSSCQGRKYSWDKCLKLFLVVISLMWFFNAIFRGAKKMLLFNLYSYAGKFRL